MVAALALSLSLSGFNSLQTGKWILTNDRRGQNGLWNKFQFPSNGKVDPNHYRGFLVAEILPHSFNSLQTGKWILTYAPDATTTTRRMCFNSLQTGKWILTALNVVNLS